MSDEGIHQEGEGVALLGGRDEFREFCFRRSSRLRIRSRACASDARNSPTSVSCSASADSSAAILRRASEWVMWPRVALSGLLRKPDTHVNAYT